MGPFRLVVGGAANDYGEIFSKVRGFGRCLVVIMHGDRGSAVVESNDGDWRI